MQELWYLLKVLYPWPNPLNWMRFSTTCIPGIIEIKSYLQYVSKMNQMVIMDLTEEN